MIVSIATPTDGSAAVSTAVTPRTNAQLVEARRQIAELQATLQDRAEEVYHLETKLEANNAIQAATQRELENQRNTSEQLMLRLEALERAQAGTAATSSTTTESTSTATAPPRTKEPPTKAPPSVWCNLTVEDDYFDAQEKDVTVADDATSVAESDRPAGFTRDADLYL